MRIHMFIFVFTCTSFFAYAQQIQLKGIVSVHNSKYETGKIIYVKDAFVSAPFTKPANTDNSGNFSLEFVGIAPGTSVTLQVEKPGLEVVNSRDLEDVVISRKISLRVFVAEKGRLAQAQTELYNVSKKALFAQKDALIAGLRAGEAESKAAIVELEEKFGQEIKNRFEAEALLNSKIAELQKRLPEFAQELAAVNLDFASELYVEAYEHFKRGEIEKAIAVLDGKKLEDAYTSTQERKTENQKLKAIVEDTEEKIDQEIRQIIKSYELKAKSLKVLFKYGEVAVQYEKIIGIYRNNGFDRKKLAFWYRKTAYAYMDLSEPQKALEFLQKALAIRKEILGPKHPDIATSYDIIGQISIVSGRFQKALEFHQKALAIRQENLGPKHPSLSNSYNNIGNSYKSLGKFQKALEFYQKALAIIRQGLNPKHPSLAASYSNISVSYKSLGDYQKALEYQQKALEVNKSLGPKYPGLVFNYINIGSIYDLLGDYRKFLEYLQKAADIEEETYGHKYPGLAFKYGIIGDTYNKLGNYQKALEYKQKALAIKKETLHADNSQLTYAYNGLGVAYENLGNHQKALEYHQEALTIWKKNLDNKHLNPTAVHSGIASTYALLGDYQKALEYQQKTLSITEKTFGSNHSYTARSYHSIAEMYLASGDAQKAVDYQQKAMTIFKAVLPEGHSDIKRAEKLLKKIKKALKKQED